MLKCTLADCFQRLRKVDLFQIFASAERLRTDRDNALCPLHLPEPFAVFERRPPDLHGIRCERDLLQQVAIHIDLIAD